MNRLAKIIKSNSHIDYVGRVIDALEADNPPAATDYGFAQFVSLPVDENLDVVGVIYNTQLLNPDYGNFGPRLSPASDLAVFSPDFINEQGVLIGILLLGWRDRLTEMNHHGVPRRVIPVNQEVYRMEDADVLDFHSDKQGCVQLHYYSQIVAHAGLFAVPLLEAILEQLSPACAEAEQKRLGVLKQALAWQRTMGGMRL
jgi:hypothetical protein